MPAIVFAVVLAAQLALVAAAGTDVPFHDQWNVEGGWLFPAWLEGRFRWVDLLRPGNEHRMVWTHALNLAVFVLNGHWDPLVQQVIIGGLRAACAAGIAWGFARGRSPGGRWAVAAGAVIAFLPHLGWHNLLWAIESHAFFALGFSMLALGLLAPAAGSPRRLILGVAAGLAALLAMGPAALVPAALIGLALLRAWEGRRWDGAAWRLVGPAAGLLLVAWLLRVEVAEHAGLRARGPAEFLRAAGQVLGWPHGRATLAAVALNAPLLWIVLGRGLRRRTAAPGEDFVVAAGGWSVAVGLATAWMRGGSPELAGGGVPSRYVDFLVLLPLANAWSVVQLARELAPRWRASARLVAAAWGVFLLAGWAGLSAEVMRGIVLPRARDREAPVRLIRAFQASGDPAVFTGQPLLLVPSPNLGSVRAVLEDPRLRGRLPPSLQPAEPLGPLSRGARGVLGVFGFAEGEGARPAGPKK